MARGDERSRQRPSRYQPMGRSIVIVITILPSGQSPGLPLADFSLSRHCKPPSPDSLRRASANDGPLSWTAEAAIRDVLREHWQGTRGRSPARLVTTRALLLAGPLTQDRARVTRIDSRHWLLFRALGSGIFTYKESTAALFNRRGSAIVGATATTIKATTRGRADDASKLTLMGS